jgi:pimeloyl-ACP methyl ester carboxylesterase
LTKLTDTSNEKASKTLSELHNWRLIRNARGRTDAPLMVLSHGFGTDHRSWRLLLPDLLKHYDIGVYDLAGAGPNGRATFEDGRHTSITAFADDLIAILDEQGISSTKILTHSVSGMVALIAACKRPEVFDHISMIAPSPHYLNEGGYHGGFSQNDLDGLFGAMEAGYEDWANGFAPVIVGDEFPLFVREFASSLLDMPTQTALKIARFIFQSDFRDILPKIKIPTTIIQPARDPAVPLEVGHYLNAKLANSTLHIINSYGHLPQLTAPYEVLYCLKESMPE